MNMDHIFLKDTQRSTRFTPIKKPFEISRPVRDVKEHSAKLEKQWSAIWAKAQETASARTAVSLSTKEGVYIEFEGAPGYELLTKDLENRKTGIRLLNVSTDLVSNKPSAVTRATVFIPAGKEGIFLKKITEYATQVTKHKGKPKHDPLMRSIENIRTAVLESFWKDTTPLPGATATWCEIWLNDSEAQAEARFRDVAKSINIQLNERVLRFPERAVLLGKASLAQLVELIEMSPDIAELRRAKETAQFFLELNNREQTEWVADLGTRLRVNPDPKVAICVLDTGANNGHILLEPVLQTSDCHSIMPTWGPHDQIGHGTLMCGLAAFGNLIDALQHVRPVNLDHCLESVKILPPQGNDPDLYGQITIQAISRAELQAPERTRIGCMAVTANEAVNFGAPSSWSAAIDQITSGYDDQIQRLFILSGGNLENNTFNDYPVSNMDASIQDPGQSWNALTIGAYTEKSLLTCPDFKDWTPLARPGELSPFSTTSLGWENQWPIKPELVLEGGNLAMAADGQISTTDELTLLSTGHKPQLHQLSPFNATSAATAQAAWLAAQIQTKYPQAWPETIRGLMVHSATWPDAMKEQFFLSKKKGAIKKTEYAKLLRYCGYGTPSLVATLNSAANSLTLIAEAEIQPYAKKPDGRNYKTNEMHLYQMPWPKEVLLSLGETPITLRITLSYFIEPGPGEVGWKNRYRYPSHGLRFDLNSPGEDLLAFQKRINQAAREEGEKQESTSASSRWLIGSNGRNSGSIHSDIWQGTAADISTCNIVGIYPTIGWWRERPWLERAERRARYSLIVSLHTPDEKIDIYTPVAIKLKIPVAISS